MTISIHTFFHGLPSKAALVIEEFLGEALNTHTPKFKLLKEISLTNGKIKEVCFSSDGNLLCFSDNQSSLYLLDETKGICSLQRKNISLINLSPSGNEVIGYGNNKAQIWNTETKKLLNEKGFPPNSSITCMEMDPTGNLLFLGGTEGYLWNIETNEIYTLDLDERIDGPERIQCASFSPESSRVVFGTDMGNLYTWCMKTKRKEKNARISHSGLERVFCHTRETVQIHTENLQCCTFDLSGGKGIDWNQHYKVKSHTSKKYARQIRDENGVPHLFDLKKVENGAIFQNQFALINGKTLKLYKR